MEKSGLRFVYWFAYFNLDSPSVRYRAKYPLKFAKEYLGINSKLVVPGYSPKKILSFIGTYFSALFYPKKNSIIVIQRVSSNFIYSNLLKLLVLARQKKTVYDLDDAVYLTNDPKTIHFFARNCNYISAGSKKISYHLSELNKRVIHITSPTPDFGIVKNLRNKEFTIGWIGIYSPGHRKSLFKYVFPALKKLEFNCRVVLIGIKDRSDREEIIGYLKNKPNIRLMIPKDIDWKNEIEIQNRISEFDVGVATLLNEEAQLAKSGIKVKQYMNNGIPVICNNLPENNNYVLDKYNGYLCDSSIEFSQRITEIREMSDEEYWEISKNARNSIQNFSHQKFFIEFKRLLSGAHSSY